jgi:hypothetical protein
MFDTQIRRIFAIIDEQLQRLEDFDPPERVVSTFETMTAFTKP